MYLCGSLAHKMMKRWMHGHPLPETLLELFIDTIFYGAVSSLSLSLSVVAYLPTLSAPIVFCLGHYTLTSDSFSLRNFPPLVKASCCILSHYAESVSWPHNFKRSNRAALFSVSCVLRFEVDSAWVLLFCVTLRLCPSSVFTPFFTNYGLKGGCYDVVARNA